MASKIINGPVPPTGRGGIGPEVESWGTSRLRRSPSRGDNFRPLPAGEPDRPAEDVGRNGQPTPNEVTPDAPIIDGHGRPRVARGLGRSFVLVLVLVNHGLAGGAWAIERRLIGGGLDRSLPDIPIPARLAGPMIEIEWVEGPGGLSRYVAPDPQDQVDATLGVPARNVRSRTNVLDAAMESRRGCPEGGLSMKPAGRRGSTRSPRHGSPRGLRPAANRARSRPGTCPRAATRSSARAGSIDRSERPRPGPPSPSTARSPGWMGRGLITQHGESKESRAETLRRPGRPGELLVGFQRRADARPGHQVRPCGFRPDWATPGGSSWGRTYA